MAGEKVPVTSLKQLKKEIQEIKRTSDPALLLRLLDYVESREKLLKDLLIHMNAVENHLVKTAELLQKMPQVNIGELADSIKQMLPKLDEIATNTRKMVDYLEMAVEEEPSEEPVKPKRAAKPKQEKEPDMPSQEPGPEKADGTTAQLEKIEEQNKSLIQALNQVSENLKRLGE